MLKTIPDFKTEQEEREFWENHDSTDYVDMKKAKLAAFPNLKSTTKAIINENVIQRKDK